MHNVFNICAQIVYKLCINCAQIRVPYTAHHTLNIDTVHKANHQAPVYTLLIPRSIHRFFADFVSVICRFIPIMHSTYKENYKSDIPFLFFLYNTAINPSKPLAC